MNTAELHVATQDEIGHGQSKLVTIGPLEIGIFRLRDGYVAWRNVCPHAGAPVCYGRIEGTMLPSDVHTYDLDEDALVLRCPWHGWEYDLQTGEHLTDRTIRLRGYPVIEREGDVYLVVPARLTASHNHESR